MEFFFGRDSSLAYPEVYIPSQDMVVNFTIRDWKEIIAENNEINSMPSN